MKAITTDKKTKAPRKTHEGESGQALVEFSLIMLTLILLVYGMMDFCVAIYEKQLLTNLSREGANLSARGVGNTQLEIMSNALYAVQLEATPLNLSNSASGRLILTAATNTNTIEGLYYCNIQLESGLMNAQSKVAPHGTNGVVNIPTNLLVSAGHTIYIAEVFYSNSVPAPLTKLIPVKITNQFYDVAYFPGG